MKKLLFLAFTLLLLTSPCFAGDQTNQVGYTLDADGNATFKSVITTTGAAREVNLPLINFYRDGDNSILTTAYDATPQVVLSATAPYVRWMFGSNNESFVITNPYTNNQGHNNSSPIFTSFRVPPDYRTGPSFVLTCQNSNVATPGYSTPQYVDWDVVIYKNDVIETGYQQYDLDPVGVYGSGDGTANAVDGGIADATIDQITLTYSTGADISAGDMIVFRCWPARNATTYNATSDFYLYNGVFRYTSQW